MSDKKRYLVVGEVTISVSVEVHAYSEQQARATAQQAPMMSLCHSCARGQRDEWSTSGEFDGTVEITGVEAM